VFLLPTTLLAGDETAFFKTHCIRCHGSEKPKSDLRFDTLSATISPATDLGRYQSVAEFRQHIIKRQDQFTRCLAEKLLTYAIGRELDVGDRPSVDSITRAMQDETLGLRDLIELVITSETFQNN
jgi:hypothetical protein